MNFVPTIVAADIIRRVYAAPKVREETVRITATLRRSMPLPRYRSVRKAVRRVHPFAEVYPMSGTIVVRLVDDASLTQRQVSRIIVILNDMVGPATVERSRDRRDFTFRFPS